MTALFLFNFMAISVGLTKSWAGVFGRNRRFSADLLAAYGSPVTT